MNAHSHTGILRTPWSVLLVAFCLVVGMGCGETGDAPASGEEITVEVEAEGGYTPGVVDLSGIDDPLARGALLYRLHCQSCHGETGKGDGDLAPFLNLPVADLTVLEAQNGGVFPDGMVYAYIDGAGTATGDGSREMPVWGAIWVEQIGGGGAEDEVQQRISYLVEYVRSLQAQPEAETE